MATVLRIKTPEGTLVIECNDPEVKVRIDDSDVVIAGTGMQEVRLNTGKHRLQAFKDGQPVKDVLVSITREGKELVKVSLEPDSPHAALGRWLKPPVPELPAPQEASQRGPAKRQTDMVAPRSHEANCLTCHSNMLGPGVEGWWRAARSETDLFARHSVVKECMLCHQGTHAPNVDKAPSDGAPSAPRVATAALEARAWSLRSLGTRVLSRRPPPRDRPNGD